MTRITFTIGEEEGEVDVEERELEYSDPRDTSTYYSILRPIHETVMITGPSEETDEYVVTQERREPTEEEIVTRLENTLRALDASFEVHDDDDEEKSVSKSVFTPQWHRWRKLQETAQDISPDCDECVRQAFREQVWPEDLNKSPSWESDDDVTQQTQEWVEAVFQLRDPLYDEYSGIPQAAALTVKQHIQDALTQPQGWSIDSVVDEIYSEFDFLEYHEAKRIARQEIAATLNQAQKISLEARPDEPTVMWDGPDDQDTTELCKEVKREIGDGVLLSEAEQIIEEKAAKYDYGTPERADQLVPHFLCRHHLEEV